MPEERAQINGFRILEQKQVNSAEAQGVVNNILNNEAPVLDSIDWPLLLERVTRVKYQGGCGAS